MGSGRECSGPDRGGLQLTAAPQHRRGRRPPRAARPSTRRGTALGMGQSGAPPGRPPRRRESGRAQLEQAAPTTAEVDQIGVERLVGQGFRDFKARADASAVGVPAEKGVAGLAGGVARYRRARGAAHAVVLARTRTRSTRHATATGPPRPARRSRAAVRASRLDSITQSIRPASLDHRTRRARRVRDRSGAGRAPTRCAGRPAATQRRPGREDGGSRGSAPTRSRSRASPTRRPPARPRSRRRRT